MKHPFILSLVLASAAVLPCSGLEVPKDAANAVHAVHFLAQQGRLVEARDVAEQWLKAHPDDVAVLSQDALTLELQAIAEGDTPTATALRKQAYRVATRARKLGADDPLLSLLLEHLNENGELTSTGTYSAVPAAAAEMQRGDQAFTKHELATALAAYAHALELDPKCYLAVLYTGDVYFSQGRLTDAVRWFTKAASLDPDRETAFRYLGDAELKAGHLAEAQKAYVKARIAAPYQRLPREMMTRLTKAAKKTVHAPAVAVYRGSASLQPDGKVAVNVAPDVDPLDLAYALSRAKWLTSDRSQYFPKNATPRHSLYEECAALRSIASMTLEMQANKEEVSPTHLASAQEIERLDDSGLLEAFVLLDRADEGIAHDYVAYRQLHRDRLVRYINEIWLADLPHGK